LFCVTSLLKFSVLYCRIH